MMKRHTQIFLLMAAVCLTLSGCIRDSLDDCRRSFTLYFRYLGDGTTDIFRDKVAEVDVYVYNPATGQLLRTLELSQSDLTNLQGVRFDDLESGTYEVVCWGNAAGHSAVVGMEQRTTGRMAAPEYHAGADISTNDELYHVAHVFTIDDAWSDQSETCDFRCAHIDTTVRLEGFDASELTRAGGCIVDLSLENLPDYYDNDATAGNEDTRYCPALAATAEDGTVYESHFKTLRYADDTAATLYLTDVNTGENVYTLPLADFLEDNKLSVEDHQEVELLIVIRMHRDDNGVVSITVSPFEEEDIHPGVDERG